MNNTTVIKSKTLSKETVFKSKNFHVDRVTVERNGKTFTKEIIEKTSCVNIIPYTLDNEIYLEWQYRDALEKVCLEVIGGKIEGDNLIDAAKRELLEETGLTAKSWKQIGILDTSVTIKQKIHVFVATDLEEGNTHKDDDEIIETVKMPLVDVLENIEKGVMTDSSQIAAVFLFKKLREEGKI